MPSFLLSLVDSLGRLDVSSSRELAAQVACRRVIRATARIVAHSADGALCVVLGVAIGYGWRESVGFVVVRALFASILSALAVAAIKAAVQRPRPDWALAGRWTSLPRYDAYSFPSGHAARAAAIGISALIVHTPGAAALLIWSVAVSLGRVSVGAHYVSDVLAGWGLGAVIAAAVAYLLPPIQLPFA